LALLFRVRLDVAAFATFPAARVAAVDIRRAPAAADFIARFDTRLADFTADLEADPARTRA
jgi:hypothetical protein